MKSDDSKISVAISTIRICTRLLEPFDFHHHICQILLLLTNNKYDVFLSLEVTKDFKLSVAQY